MYSNDLNTVELCDDVDNLLFLCERLHSRLSQVTLHVDEVRQTWTQKRRSIESDPNLSPIVAQKAARCNKILLSVAERLAIVELQTESLRNLQVSMTHTTVDTPQKREGNYLQDLFPVSGKMTCDVLASPSLSSLNQTVSTRPPSSVQMNHFKQEAIGSGFAPLRDLSSTTTRSLSDQRLGAATQTPLLVSTKTPTDMLRSRGSLTLFNDTTSAKGPIEPSYASPSSSFHRTAPPSAQQHLAAQNQQPLSLGLAASRMSSNRMIQKPEESGAVASFQLPTSHLTSTRLGSHPKPFARM